MTQKHSHLPHIDLTGHYQFVTFRTHESIDDYIRKLHHSDIKTSQKEYLIDRYLDRSANGAYLQSEVLRYLYDFFLECDRELYDLVAFCIMPNHVHLLFRQTLPLAKTMQRLKGASAIEINRRLNRKGKFWASDYFDKAIRDEKHFGIVYEYIKNNPMKAGIVGGQERFFGINA